jgi:hypothetical protein
LIGNVVTGLWLSSLVETPFNQTIPAFNKILFANNRCQRSSNNVAGEDIVILSAFDVSVMGNHVTGTIDQRHAAFNFLDSTRVTAMGNMTSGDAWLGSAVAAARMRPSVYQEFNFLGVGS